MKINLPLLNLSNSELIILTFIVTGLWDVVLRIMNENWEKLPPFIKNLLPFIKYLDPYFKEHTLLAAALIAFVIKSIGIVSSEKSLTDLRDSMCSRKVLERLSIFVIVNKLNSNF